MWLVDTLASTALEWKLDGTADTLHPLKLENKVGGKSGLGREKNF